MIPGERQIPLTNCGFREYRTRITAVTEVCRESGSWTDGSARKVPFVAVDENVKLEVLDWGISGRSLVFLLGLGNTAHGFDDFAPKLPAQSSD